MLYFKDIKIFNSLVKEKKYKCPFCVKVFKQPDQLYSHVESFHKENIDDERSVKQIVYDETHPGDHLCQICKINKCVWNEKTGRYSTLCSNPACREEARRRFRENYKKKNGKEHTLNDPEIQKEMMKRRKTSGIYRFKDGRVLPYISSYEEDFLKFVDLSLGLTVDEIKECPFVFFYKYEDEKHFYIPDYYIEPLDLIVEIKADSDVTHPKILAIDKEKEKLKEEAVKKDGTHNYIKICDKEYESFVTLYEMLKNETVTQNPSREKIVLIPERKETIKGFKMPELKFIANDKVMCNSFIMKKIFEKSDGILKVSLVVDSCNLKANDLYKIEPYNKISGIKELKTYECDFKDDNNIKKTFDMFSKYYTKENEILIDPELLSIRMNLDNHENFYICGVKNISKDLQNKIISKIEYFCINEDINTFSFIETSIGFDFIAKLENKDHEKSLTELFKKLVDKTVTLEFDKSNSVVLPGTYDCTVETKIIK